MGKRSDFDKRPQDQYLTPWEAVKPLIPFLDNSTRFYEPCAGDGRLVGHISYLLSGAKCTGYSDIDPRGAFDLAVTEYGGAHFSGVAEKDALTLTRSDLNGANTIITNPPWTRTKASGYLLHTMIEHFSDMVPTWLLFDADWAHTRQAGPFMQRCTHIVSVGRVKWIPGSKATGKDNVAWYRFDRPEHVITYPYFVYRD